MTKLVFGVLDLPYADAASYSTVGSKKPRKRKSRGSITTGSVANILEARYHIMETFYELHGDFVLAEMINSYEGVLESIEMGAPSTIDPAGPAAQKVEARFREFLFRREMDGLGIPGIPTKASLEGHSKRFKKSKARRSSRPSFIDTGLYEGAFRMWLDEEDGS